MSLELSNFLVAVINMVASVYVAFLALRFTARPRIRISFSRDTERHLSTFAPGERVELMFTLTNIGHWFAHPAALSNTLYLNFDTAFEPIEARYGSALEFSTNEVRRGKNNCKYLKVSGIHLFYGEPGELVVITTTMPAAPGTYEFWVASMSSGGDHGVQRFHLTVSTSSGQLCG